ncbi:maleate cis-trans isomerase family protein [Nocardia brasiliensis]
MTKDSVVYRIAGPRPQRGVGIVAPFDLALDRELWRWVSPEVSLYIARTPYAPVTVSVKMAELLSDTAELAAATRSVLTAQPEVVAYLCTVGSFVKGLAFEQSLRDVMVSAGAKGAVTTSGALVEAIREMRLTRISVLTPYDRVLTGKLNDFIAEAGCTVIHSDYLGLDSGIWKLEYRTIADRIAAVADARSEAVFVSCTNLPTYDIIAPLERALGIPVLTANQLTFWACLRRMNLPPVGPGRWLRHRTARPAD